MKICPYCAAENRDEAAVCYFCGRDLGTFAPPPPSQTTTGRTQPVRARPATGGVSSTQQLHPAPRPTDTQPYYPPQNYPPPPPAYAPPPYSQPVDVPPVLPQRRGPSRFWTVLVLTLGLGLLCGFGMAIWTLSSTGGLGAQWATRAADGFALPAFPAPTETPQPTSTPEVVAVPDPTQDGYVNKLLSPECSVALDHMERVSNQMKEQPTAPLDEAWRADFSQAINDMKTFCGSLDSASPVPEIVSEAQQNLDQANGEFDQANQLFKEGVDELNPGKLLEAGQHVQQASKHLGVAIEELRKIGQ